MAKDISQRGLAAMAKINRSTLRAIEEGRSPGDVYTLERLMSALGYELMALHKDSKPLKRNK